jgi:hypothetical protein
LTGVSHRRHRWLAALGLSLLVIIVAAAGFIVTAAFGAAATPTATTSGTSSTTPTTTPSCKPNDLRLAAGSPQTAKVGTAFQTNLQVVLANKSGCALTGSLSGVSVTFTAPSGGPSGTFASSGSNTATVGTDASGAAVAPTFTANSSEGDYEVRAESRYGSVTFYLTNTAAGVAASIAATSPSEQAATINSQYAQPLQVRVLDAHGAAVKGVTVTFALGTGASGAGASFLGGGAQTTAETDASGLATSPAVVANDKPGPFTATASASGIATVVSFSLDNHAASYAIKATSSAAQTATINKRYATPLQAQVLDQAGQPIEGATVTFSLGTGPSGATASFVGGAGAQATALTDASGKASSPAFTANGISGRFSATATVPGGISPVSYALRNLAGRLSSTQAAQTATVNRRFRQRLRARLLDARGQGLDGISVTFTISKAASGASASFLDGTAQAAATTDAAGWATSPTLVANNVAGRFTATASATSIGSMPVSFILRNIAGRPATITAGSASGESTAVGSRFPIRLAVTVIDADDNPVVGATITFIAPVRGPSGRFSIPKRGHRHATQGSRVVRVKTDSNGIAVAPPLTANATPGGYVVTATVRGSLKHTAFALINRSAAGE